MEASCIITHRVLLKDICFHHHSERHSGGSDDWWFEGEVHSILTNENAREADSHSYLHLHSVEPTMSIEEAEKLKGNTQAFLFPKVISIEPCDPITCDDEPDKNGFLIKVESDKPFMTGIY